MFDHPLHRDISFGHTMLRPEMPMGDGTVFPAGPAFTNLVVQEKAEFALESWSTRKWGAYIFTHHRPYRVDALLRVINEVGVSKVWPLVGDVWIDSESIHASSEEWEEIWSLAYAPDGTFRRSFRKVMAMADQRAFAALPETIVAYRGCACQEGIYSFSWTLSYETASWFARRFARGNASPVVAKIRIPKSVVLAHFNTRNEAEIVLNPDSLIEEDIEEIISIEGKRAA